MYFLLCCFTVTQCQLSLFNGGYLKAGGTKRVHIAPLFIPASWIGWKKNLVKRNASQWTQKKCTMLTVFQIPLIGFFTMRRKPPLFLSSTSTNNTLTKPPNPAFCSRTKPPRLSKRSHWRTKKRIKKKKKPSFHYPPPPFFFLQERKKEWGGWRDCQWINNISLLKEERWPLRCTGLREKERGEINKVWLARSLCLRGAAGARKTRTLAAGEMRELHSPGGCGRAALWLAGARGSLSAGGRRSNLLSIFWAPRLRLRRARRWEKIHAVLFYFLAGAGEGGTGRGEREEEIVKWSDNSGQPHGSLEGVPPLRTAASPHTSPPS